MRNLFKIAQLAKIKRFNVEKVVKRGDQTKMTGKRLSKIQIND